MFHLHARVRSYFVLGGVFLFAACSDLPERLNAPNASTESAALQSDDVHAALAAQERHTPTLMRVPGVLGTAVGLNPAGRAVLQVLLLDDSPRNIPDVLDGIPVQRKVTGLLMARSDPTTKARPAPLGYSIGHPLITAGTIGARVVNSSGSVFALSNNHVLANSNDASIGDAALQPGPYDGGTSADQIGTLAAFRPIDFSGASNTFDAAIAASTTANLGNATPLDDAYGVPNSVIFDDANNDRVFDDKAHLLNVNVEKYGRTTKLTHGRITGINATVDICYEVVVIFCVKSAHYTDQLLIGQSGFSDGGDSGSLIVTDNASHNPVALLFAGSTTETIANRIDLVLNYFSVTVDGSASAPPDPVTDASVVGINAAASYTQGATPFIGAVVRNAGNQPIGAFDVTMLDQTDGVTIGTVTVASLAVGEQASVVFSWNTSTSSIGTHVLVASHNLADANAANNTISRSTQITAPVTPVTDVATTSVTGPASATQGATANISVVVKNVGNQSVGAFNVTLDDQTDVASIGTQTVSGLSAGASATLTFPWNTTTASLGTHTLTATHNLSDASAANNSASTTVQVNAFVPTVDIHVGDIDASTSNDGGTWSARVEVTVHDASHLALNGAVVVGSWSSAGLNSNTCTSGEGGGSGTCIMLFPGLKKSTKSVSFTVTGVSMSGKTYKQPQNHDPDGSSNGTTQVVNRP
ncbi:MAG TPA: CARDB domain-containing protein [Gemmatimonadaceae bacterium]|nr:CARDB domain-containing protein [Gemmatimonadaceae bacterium]